MAERDAIWSAAVHAYRNGERNYLPADLANIVSQENESYQVENPWKAPIADWLNAASNQGVELTSEIILSKAIVKPIERQTKVDQMQVAAIMRDMGYGKVRRAIGGQQRWVFTKG
jgi:predicted P-loop ATPase